MIYMLVEYKLWFLVYFFFRWVDKIVVYVKIECFYVVMLNVFLINLLWYSVGLVLCC